MTLQSYQTQFLDFAIEVGVLKFGEFTLKSGRISPYFFNSGLFNTGSHLAKLGRFYAEAIVNAKLDYDMLFGPAYKGIPLVAAVAIALADHHQRDVPYAFNRKEIKDHGEGGRIVGAPLVGKVLIIDDVVSAGTSVRESIDMIQTDNATPAGVSISLDRQERGTGPLSATQEITQQSHIPVANIVTLTHLISYLDHKTEYTNALEMIRAYQVKYRPQE